MIGFYYSVTGGVEQKAHGEFYMQMYKTAKKCVDNEGQVLGLTSKAAEQLADCDLYRDAIADGATTTETAFGWTSSEVAWWHDQRKFFLDDVTGLWMKHENPLTRNSSINEQVVEFIKKFHIVANPMLDRAAASPGATIDLSKVFNFKIGRSAPTHPTVPIEGLLYGIYVPLGGGKVKGKMFSDLETHRSALNTAEHSDAVEIAFTFGETEMTNPYAIGTTHKQFSKATFTVDMGMNNSNSAVWINQRSINTKHPELDGPWNKAQKFYLQ